MRRLQASMTSEGTAERDLDATYGPQVAAMLMLIGRAMRDIADIFGEREVAPQMAQTPLPGLDLGSPMPPDINKSEVAFAVEQLATRPKDWLDDAFAYSQAGVAVNVILRGLAPQGEPVLPAGEEVPGEKDLLSNIGWDHGRWLLFAVRGRSAVAGELGKWAAQVRERLGPIASRIVVPLSVEAQAIGEAVSAELAGPHQTPIGRPSNEAGMMASAEQMITMSDEVRELALNYIGRAPRRVRHALLEEYRQFVTDAQGRVEAADEKEARTAAEAERAAVEPTPGHSLSELSDADVAEMAQPVEDLVRRIVAISTEMSDAERAALKASIAPALEQGDIKRALEESNKRVEDIESRLQWKQSQEAHAARRRRPGASRK